LRQTGGSVLFDTNPILNMKNKLAIVLGVAVLLLSGQRAFTADATNELKTLVTKINADIAAGKQTESGLADDLKQFDVLLAEHKGEKTDIVAQILYMKATLYGEVLNNDAKAQELLKQLKTDFKGTPFVANLEKQEAAAAAAKMIQDSLVVGTKFPDFDETDVAGQPLSIASHKGRVVLVDFWATWCVPCRFELPNVITTYQKYHAKGFDIIGVNLDQDKTQMLSFTKDENMNWQQFFDGQRWENKLAVKYAIQAIPATYLLDGDGKIIGKDLRGDALEQAVANALAKK
jgi:thiol-disulfide isomerase/thioredoxin